MQVLNFSTHLLTFTTATWERAAKFGALNWVDSYLECVEKIGFASIDRHAFSQQSSKPSDQRSSCKVVKLQSSMSSVGVTGDE